MIDAENAATQLDEDKRIRLGELAFLEKICDSLADEESQNRMRKSLILMLYAQFEGFVKTALDIYRRHIDESGLSYAQVLPELATSAFADVFKAFQGSSKAIQNFLPEQLRELKDEMQTFAIQSTLVDRATNYMSMGLKIPDKYIDMESNLKPIVLRKNLFRLALPFNMFDDYDGVLNRLLSQRNNIAHGALVAGIDKLDYQEIRSAVMKVIDELNKKIIEAILNRSYLRKSPKN